MNLQLTDSSYHFTILSWEPFLIAIHLNFIFALYAVMWYPVRSKTMHIVNYDIKHRYILHTCRPGGECFPTLFNDGWYFNLSTDWLETYNFRTLRCEFCQNRVPALYEFILREKDVWNVFYGNFFSIDTNHRIWKHPLYMNRNGLVY